ncbi:MAG: 50S ribosomal protein L7/L12 [Oscillospiraceae bacterium]|nr:50S ribosomal protein L7/L12 [Oscillospiraceae bacterium]MBR4797790.1 50S ribosomal protein L7/L12 [Oscillospiraceae bacterium]MBR4827795.1 50S ribosomal protein L7/L12 [Oscillospiraceae bacterium]MBR5064933.1 50S ribosomal protein L7/L12 [Oscillospiraceae bacterium]MBR5070983.1 50S ribosomal protein L7/L12 [Oscillospiraceae bacterium]
MADISSMIEAIKGMTVMELSELVKAIEEEFGVSAAAAVAAAPAESGAAAAAEEKSEYEVVLTEVGETKMNVIKAIKDILGLGLKESKELVDAAPKTVKAGISKEEADEIVAKLKEAGATTEVK